MEIKTLYKTVIDGKTTVSPIEPQTPYTLTYRVMAADGAEITDGETVCTVIDTDTPSDWHEVSDTTAEEVLNILMGVSE